MSGTCENCGEELTTFCLNCHEEEEYAHTALSREATALRQQRDRLREALDRIANTSEGRDAAGHIARAALAQCDTQEGV